MFSYPVWCLVGWVFMWCRSSCKHGIFTHQVEILGVVVSRGLCWLRDVTSGAYEYSLVWPWGVRLPWWCRWPALQFRHMISTICVRRGFIVVEGTDWVIPKTQPTKFEIYVEFPPPGVIWVSWYLQAVGIQSVPLDIVSDDEAKVNFQSGVEANPDCDENWDVEDQCPVPFCTCDVRHVG